MKIPRSIGRALKRGKADLIFDPIASQHLKGAQSFMLRIKTGKGNFFRYTNVILSPQ